MDGCCRPSKARRRALEHSPAVTSFPEDQGSFSMSKFGQLCGLATRRTWFTAASLVGSGLGISALIASISAAGCGAIEELEETSPARSAVEVNTAVTAADCVLPPFKPGNATPATCPDGASGCYKYRAVPGPDEDNWNNTNTIQIGPPPGLTYPLYVDVHLWGPGGERPVEQPISGSNPPASFVLGNGGAGGLSVLKVKLLHPCSWFEVQTGVTRLETGPVMGYGSRLKTRSKYLSGVSTVDRTHTMLVAGSGGWGGRSYGDDAPHGGATGQDGLPAFRITPPETRTGGKGATPTSCGLTVSNPSPCNPAPANFPYDCSPNQPAIVGGCAEGYFGKYSRPGQGAFNPGFPSGFAGSYGFHGNLWGGGGGGASNVVYAATFPPAYQAEDMEILDADTMDGSRLRPPDPHGILTSYQTTVGGLTYTVLEAAGGSAASSGRGGEGVVYMSWSSNPIAPPSACDPETELEVDFSHDAAGNGIPHHALLDEQYAAWGVHFDGMFSVGQTSIDFADYSVTPLPLNFVCTYTAAKDTGKCVLPLGPKDGKNTPFVVDLDFPVEAARIQARTRADGPEDGDQMSITAFDVANNQVSTTVNASGNNGPGPYPYLPEGILNAQISDPGGQIRRLVVKPGDTDALGPMCLKIGPKLRDVTDFNPTSLADLVWQHTDGRIFAWLMSATQDGLAATGSGWIQSTALADWKVVATGDFGTTQGNATPDGNTDLVLQHTDGRAYVWFMNGLSVVGQGAYVNPSPLAGWKIVGAGDFGSPSSPHADNRMDIVWQKQTDGQTDGQISIWFLNGFNASGHFSAQNQNVVTTAYAPRVRAVCDFGQSGINATPDRHPDLVLQDPSTGKASVRFMSGAQPLASAVEIPNQGSYPGWTLTGASDLNGDGKRDLQWQYYDWTTYVWYMNGINRIDEDWISTDATNLANWRLVGGK
jgi:hypothetical protein